MGLGLMPNNILAKLIQRTLENTGDRDISSKLTTLTKEMGAEGRSMLLNVEGQGIYYFVIEDGKLRYLKTPIANPTTTTTMTFKTFLEIWERRISAMTAWKHNLIQFTASDDRALFHISVVMEMFQKMREIMGM